MRDFFLRKLRVSHMDQSTSPVMLTSQTFITSLKYSALGLMLASSAHSAVTAVIESSSKDWAAIGYGDNVTPDTPDDHQTGGVEGDLVGSMGVPFFYTLYNEGTLSFRTRHGGDADSAGFGGILYIGIDVNNDLTIDAYVGVDHQGNNTDVFIATADSGDNNSVSSLGYEVVTTSDHEEVDDIYNWREVGADDFDYPDPELDIDGALTPDKKNDDSPDYFLSFQIEFSELERVLGEDYDITTGTGFSYIAGTSTQPNSFNQDIGGINGNDENFDPDKLFEDYNEDSGVTSNPTTPTGLPIPEPSTSILLLISGLFMTAYRKRQTPPL